MIFLYQFSLNSNSASDFNDIWMGNKLIKIALISRYLIVKIRKSQNQTSNSCLLKAGVGGVQGQPLGIEIK